MNVGNIHDTSVKTFPSVGARLISFDGYFLAHLWGAYAIPVALSGVRRLS